MARLDPRILRKMRSKADQYKSTNLLFPSYWRTRHWSKSPHRIVQLVRRYSESVDGIASRAIGRYHDRLWDDIATEVEDLDLRRTLARHMRKLDQLFFFGLLTREVRSPGSLTRSEQLVRLRVHERNHRTSYGRWNPDRGVIEIWTQAFHRRNSFQRLFLALAHEMAHAYLDIFSNRNSSAFARDVDPDDGHGPMFNRLFHILLFRLNQWAPGLHEIQDELPAQDSRVTQMHQQIQGTQVVLTV
ncbi:hypothetical protein JX265_000936 [Neoarthrinium moseri]|uniref:SprT-like domain-containing protein n=1 Tax=Neoarthrinium moseri TaxID=1658444 RepID=A0A9P9WWV3_9PEZI|nr:hypothetical protein JX266_007820 [Neoarthrinium moseri]KAI1880696.1 hypothetical protein JX265_000936 [Neoarthrinium moseri]